MSSRIPRRRRRHRLGSASLPLRVSLAVPQNSRIISFARLDGTTKVGVQVGSIAAMTLDQRHVRISIFGFEDDMLDGSGRMRSTPPR